MRAAAEGGRASRCVFFEMKCVEKGKEEGEKATVGFQCLLIFHSPATCLARFLGLNSLIPCQLVKGSAFALKMNLGQLGRPKRCRQMACPPSFHIPGRCIDLYIIARHIKLSRQLLAPNSCLFPAVNCT